MGSAVLPASSCAAPTPLPPSGDALRELWERRGRHTVTAGGVCWGRHRAPAYTPLAPELRLDCSLDELDALLSAHRTRAVRAPVADPTGGGGVHVVKLDGYSLRSVNKGQRRNVERGLDGSDIRRLEPSELERLGMPLNLDTLRRQGRDDPEFGSAGGWRAFTEALAACPAIRVHGVFVEGVLANYLISAREDPWRRMLWRASCSARRHHRGDHALDFTILTEAAADPGLAWAVNGQVAALGDEGLDRYKRHLGYVREPRRPLVRVHPRLASFARSSLASCALGLARSRRPDDVRLKLAARMLTEAEADRGHPGRAGRRALTGRA